MPTSAAFVATASRVLLVVDRLDHAPGKVPDSKPSEKPTGTGEVTVSVALRKPPQLPMASRRRTLTV